MSFWALFFFPPEVIFQNPNLGQRCCSSCVKKAFHPRFPLAAPQALNLIKIIYSEDTAKRQLELGASGEGLQIKKSLGNYILTIQVPFPSPHVWFWGLVVLHWIPSLSPGLLFLFLSQGCSFCRECGYLFFFTGCSPRPPFMQLSSA